MTKLDQLILDLLESDAKVSASSQALMASKVYSGYIDHVPKQITSLHLTAYFRLNEAAGTLLRHGRRSDLKDSDGQTPLSWAAWNGHDNVVKLLLETGKVNADSKDTCFARTPLSWAAWNGHDGIVKLLRNHQQRKLQVWPLQNCMINILASSSRIAFYTKWPIFAPPTVTELGQDNGTSTHVLYLGSYRRE